MTRLLIQQLILTGIDNPRAASFEDLRSAAPREFDRSKIYAAASPRDALRIAHGLTTHEGLILVTGSLYLVGAAQEILKAQPPWVAHLEAPH